MSQRVNLKPYFERVMREKFLSIIVVQKIAKNILEFSMKKHSTTQRSNEKSDYERA